MKKFLNFLVRCLEKFASLMEIKHECPDCKIEMDTYAVYPGDAFYYICPKCKKEDWSYVGGR